MIVSVPFVNFEFLSFSFTRIACEVLNAFPLIIDFLTSELLRMPVHWTQFARYLVCLCICVKEWNLHARTKCENPIFALLLYTLSIWLSIELWPGCTRSGTCLFFLFALFTVQMFHYVRASLLLIQTIAFLYYVFALCVLFNCIDSFSTGIILVYMNIATASLFFLYYRLVLFFFSIIFRRFCLILTIFSRAYLTAFRLNSSLDISLLFYFSTCCCYWSYIHFFFLSFFISLSRFFWPFFHMGILCSSSAFICKSCSSRS